MLLRLAVSLSAAIIVLASCLNTALAQGSTVAGDALIGGGAFATGLGWYNLNTAKANSIDVATTIKWQSHVRRILAENRASLATLAAGKAAKAKDVERRQQAREQQLRNNPSNEDIASGEALNILFYDLSDPDITREQWLAKAVALPAGFSVKNVPFQYMSSNPTGKTTALGRGVIALSRLEVNGKWPVAFNANEIEQERLAYEKSYTRVRDQIFGGQLSIDTLLSMDRSLDSLRSKVQEVVPTDRGFQGAAVRYVDDLKSATRMFDASTVEYAQELLRETTDHDATTVYELILFMLKYRLQFASNERDPSGRDFYRVLYGHIHEQLKELNPAYGSMPEKAIDVVTSTPAAPALRPLKERLAGTKWVNTNEFVFEWDRNGEFWHCKGEERNKKKCVFLGPNRVQVTLLKDAIFTLLFNDDFTGFKQIDKNGKVWQTAKRFK
jgi:hypothetical protein